MRLHTLIVAIALTLALAMPAVVTQAGHQPGPQAGPKKDEKAKPDSTATEKAGASKDEKAEAEKAAAEKAKAEKAAAEKAKAEKAAAEKAKAEKAAAEKAKGEKAAAEKASAAGTQSKTAPQKDQKAAPAAQGAKPAGEAKGPVRRAQLTTGIENHEPIDAVSGFTTATDQLFFFTEIVGMEGQTVTHIWKYGDEVKAEVPITIGSPRWRAYSSKKMLPSWTGQWTVEVVDSTGTVLQAEQFDYTAGAPAPQGSE